MMARDLSAVDRYIAALRRELAGVPDDDLERIVDEVRAHLLDALEDAPAAGRRHVDAVLARFGTASEVARLYRDSRSLEPGVAGSSPLGRIRPDGSAHPASASLPRNRPRLSDLMNLGQILRNLFRHPAFAAVTIATLALGIGANAVILSVVDGVLLEPLPFPHADRLVRVFHRAPGLDVAMDDIGLTQATYHLFRDAGVLEDLAIYNAGAANISGDEEPRRVTSVSVSHSFFDTLGVPPLLGRTFNEADEAPDAAEVVLLSESLWRSSFGARVDVIGETIIKDSRSAEIVGVMPALDFPAPDAGIWEVMTLSRAPGTLGSLGTDSVGRLPPAMTVREAGAQLAARIADLAAVFPDEPTAPILARAGLTADAIDLHEELVGDIESTLWLLLGSVGFVLLIACANVANLFLVRAEGREREMAIRAAMGAGRGRLATGFIAESAVLGLLAGAVGLLLAVGGVRLLVRFGPERLPRAEAIGIDATVLGATLALSLLAGLLFGTFPALRYNAAWLAATLKEGGRAHTAGRSRFRMRSVLVATQVALALVLLVGSGLMVRSYASLSAVDPGFDPDSMLTFRLMLNPHDYPGDEAPARFIQSAIDELAAMPGVVAVAATDAPPLTNRISGQGYSFENEPLADGELPPVHMFKYVSAGYFETMGIPVLAGRSFERADHEERRPSVIVNHAFARQHWPGEDPVGRRIQQGGARGVNPDNWYTIVGVVGDVRGNGPPSAGGGLLEEEPVGVVYFPLLAILRQDEAGNRTSPAWNVRNPVFLVRTTENPSALTDPVRRRIWTLDANLPIAEARPMEDIVDEAMAQKSFTMMLLLAGSAGALLIGAVGIYGVISYVVAQQTREIGVRMALGARAADIRRMVLRRSLWITGVGIAFGTVGAWYLTRFIATLLYGIDPLDPTTFVAVIATLLAVAALAGWMPARRATRVDPLQALHHD